MSRSGWAGPDNAKPSVTSAELPNLPSPVGTAASVDGRHGPNHRPGPVEFSRPIIMRAALGLAFGVSATTCTADRSSSKAPPQEANSELSPRPATPSVRRPTGLAQGDGLRLVRAQCTVCHSARLITQNHGTRAQWKTLIRWMQRTQGLWPIPPQVEKKILDYLEAHYGPRPYMRRAPLPPHLIPPKPRR